MYLKHGRRFQEQLESESNRSTLPSITNSFIKNNSSRRSKNIIKPNQSTTLSSLSFTLDEWDKKHVKPTKEQSQFWHRRLVRRSKREN